ncbi:hypothetical protein WICPIJ_006189 [Wickerhamomyces pijperi]|uniref:SET domain-containing protein n=1 Tax=Wickerhamomyces pijperi TaxID=599730 RepID=A0A9P8TL94_WICPI|nr:hypothetical protein WICPIJ_006189 [Wickerhamomyces pijperi]
MSIQESKIDDLLSWAQANGAKISPALKFEYTQDKGITARSMGITSIENNNEPQLQIPKKLIISSELSKKVFPDLPETSNINAGLKLLLAKLKFDSINPTIIGNEENLTEFFAPYVNLLPAMYETGCPYYWNEEELKSIEGTNLGGSLQAKLDSIYKEWLDLMKKLPQPFRDDRYESDLKLSDRYYQLDKDDFLKEVANVQSYTSFGAYLYSTVIFTSRAFPHHILDPNCGTGEAILLPLIDLLNHDNSTKIDWAYTKTTDQHEGFFSLHNKDDLLHEGDEVLNNYGAKGNEELLLGYGFVIPGNKNDSIALRVKLPLHAVQKLIKEGITIPKIEDYTQFAFNTEEQTYSGEPTDEDIKDGLLYFINRSNLIPANLLELFTHLNKNDSEQGKTVTLRARLQALQNLRGALELKQKFLKKKPEIDMAFVAHKNFVKNGEVYREGQMELYKLVVAEIKTFEKQLLNDYKSDVLTLKKIFKKDYDLQELLLESFGWNRYEIIESNDFVDATLYVWIILHTFVQIEREIDTDEEDYTPYEFPEFLRAAFFNIKNDPKLKVIEQFNNLSGYLHGILKDHAVGQFITTENLSWASEVVKRCGYTRGSTGEIIIIKPREIK